MSGRLTDAQVAALEALAAQATPGPYRWEQGNMVSDATGNVGEDDPRYCDEAIIITDSGYYPPHGPDAPYLAALDPQAVLSLLAEVQQSRQRRCGTCEHWGKGDGGDGWCGLWAEYHPTGWHCADWAPKEPQP